MPSNRLTFVKRIEDALQRSLPRGNKRVKDVVWNLPRSTRLAGECSHGGKKGPDIVLRQAILNSELLNISFRHQLSAGTNSVEQLFCAGLLPASRVLECRLG